jgi:hypothetical protein
MARFEDSGLDAVEKQILALGDKAKPAISAMLFAGSLIIKEKQQSEIRSMFKSDRTTGALADSIKTSKEQERNGKHWIEIYPQGKNRRGERFATIGFVLEHGRKNMKSRPWFTAANAKAHGEVMDAMRGAWEGGQNAGS